MLRSERGLEAQRPLPLSHLCSHLNKPYNNFQSTPEKENKKDIKTVVTNGTIPLGENTVGMEI